LPWLTGSQPFTSARCSCNLLFGQRIWPYPVQPALPQAIAAGTHRSRLVGDAQGGILSLHGGAIRRSGFVLKSGVSGLSYAAYAGCYVRPPTFGSIYACSCNRRSNLPTRIDMESRRSSMTRTRRLHDRQRAGESNGRNLTNPSWTAGPLGAGICNGVIANHSRRQRHNEGEDGWHSRSNSDFGGGVLWGTAQIVDNRSPMTLSIA
jgi:hypothetical protein